MEARDERLLVGAELKCRIFEIIGVKIGISLDEVLLLLIVHLANDQVGSFLIDSDLSFNDPVVNQANERTKALVIHAGKFDHLVSNNFILLLNHKWLFLFRLAFLRICKLVFLFERPAFLNIIDEIDEWCLDLVLYLVLVVDFDFLMMAALLTSKLINVDTTLILLNVKGGLLLHLEKEPIDVHKSRQIVGSRVN